jgi:predicted amidophosphoribosyltransferase
VTPICQCCRKDLEEEEDGLCSNCRHFTSALAGVIDELKTGWQKEQNELHQHRGAVQMLYHAHRIVKFDTPEDDEIQRTILARAVEILGYTPEPI